MGHSFGWRLELVERFRVTNGAHFEKSARRGLSARSDEDAPILLFIASASKTVLVFYRLAAMYHRGLV